MRSREILIPTLAAVLSLVCTFVLFRYLQSFASAENPFLGGNIKYGGALGGFVLIFWLLTKTFYKVASQDEKKTPIDIAGEWDTETRENVPDGLRKGMAVIDQRPNDPTFDVTMELEEIDDPNKKLAIKSLIGYIRGREIIWVYESSGRQVGIAMANAHEDRPQRLRMRYYDSVFDELKGRQGSVDWVRRSVRTRKPPK